MGSIEECYRVLGILPGASLQEIKEAYRDLVMVWHPDRYSHNPRLQQKAQEQLRQINLAHETITQYLRGGGFQWQEQERARQQNEQEHREREKRERAERERQQQEEREKQQREQKEREEQERQQREEHRREQERQERYRQEAEQRYREEQRKQRENREHRQSEPRACSNCGFVIEAGAYKCFRCGCESSKCLSSEERKVRDEQYRSRSRHEAQGRRSRVTPRKPNSTEMPQKKQKRMCARCGFITPKWEYQCPRCGCDITKSAWSNEERDTLEARYCERAKGSGPSKPDGRSDGGESWFAKIGYVEVGPLTSESLRRMAHSGELAPDTMLRREGSDGSIQARMTEGFFDEKGRHTGGQQ